MKKKVFVIIHLLVLVAVLLCSCLDKQPESVREEKLYPNTAIVDRIEDNNIVVCVDCNENVWAFEDTDNWKEGDIVSLLMNDKGTDNIKDDEIVSTQYSGTVKGLR